MTGIDWESISLLRELDAAELQKARHLFTRRDYGPGDIVIREGEPGLEMFILVSGRVRIVKSMVLPGMDIEVLGGKDTSKVLATLDGSGHPVFGEMSLVADSPRSATVETLETASFLVTDRERFFGLVEADPRLGCKLLAALCGRMAEMVRSSNVEVVKLTTALALLLSERRCA